MNETTIQTTPASRREGAVMAIKNNRKRLVATVIALAGLTGGAVAAHASTFGEVATGAVVPASMSEITPTCPTTSCAVNLFAGPGSVTVKDTSVLGGTQAVPFYGFGVNAAPVALAGSPNSTIKVQEGTTLTISLTQDPSITDPIDLSFPSFAAGSVVRTGSVGGYTYTLTATKLGTSVFQPGSNPGAPKQVAMGLVGVIIVTPATCTSTTKSCAYDGAVAYTDEALVATTDLDLDFATNSPNFPGMGYFGQSRMPDGTPRHVYHVINGKSFPDTQVIDVRANDSVLLRSVNAGVSDRSMSLLGLRQTLLARNASKYNDPQTFIAPLVGPGETADLVVQIPGGATEGQRYALIDAGRQMNHGNTYGFGGALTFFNVWPAAPTVDTLGAVAGLAAAASIGNPLVDRAYATDFPTPIGTLSPVLVVLPGSPLPAGTLTSFASWNQASAGGSPTPSAGGLLHAYVLRPTGTANQYQVIFDSGLLTVPSLAVPLTSAAAAFPTAGVAVRAGDVLGYFGQGVPVDIVITGTDILSYPATTAPVAGQTVTLGDPAFPIYPQARTYSFGATVNPYSGTTTLTATGHSAGATHNVTGYQTVVNAGAAPGPADWSATTAVTAAPTVAISASLPALPGQTIWIRVQQDGVTWSTPASIVVPVP